MITLERLCAMLAGVQAPEVERWISQDWVRAERRGQDVVFREIDVARVRLIHELRDELEVGEEALPLVLSLMDQLYETRRQVRLLCEAIEHAGGGERETVAEALRRHLESEIP